MSTANRIVDPELTIELDEDEVLDDLSITDEDEGTLEVGAAPDEGEVAPVIPEKFKGKSYEDVVESYTQLERELGRKNNEVGELRHLADDFIRQQLSVDNSTTSEAVKEEIKRDQNNPMRKIFNENVETKTGLSVIISTLAFLLFL